MVRCAYVFDVTVYKTGESHHNCTNSLSFAPLNSILTVDCDHVFDVDLHNSNVDQCPLPVIVSGVSAIPLTLTTARRAVRSD